MLQNHQIGGFGENAFSCDSVSALLTWQSHQGQAEMVLVTIGCLWSGNQDTVTIHSKPEKPG
jgi:hypothetical protein